jgi:hypothetical protein
MTSVMKSKTENQTPIQKQAHLAAQQAMEDTVYRNWVKEQLETRQTPLVVTEFDIMSHSDLVNLDVVPNEQLGREVDPTKVNKIVECIKNSKLGVVYKNPPIILTHLNDKLHVVEGQHRIAVANELKLHWLVVIIESLSEDDLGFAAYEANNSDELPRYTNDQKSDVDRLVNMIKKNPDYDFNKLKSIYEGRMGANKKADTVVTKNIESAFEIFKDGALYSASGGTRNTISKKPKDFFKEAGYGDLPIYSCNGASRHFFIWNHALEHYRKTGDVTYKIGLYSTMTANKSQLYYRNAMKTVVTNVEDLIKQQRDITEYYPNLKIKVEAVLPQRHGLDEQAIDNNECITYNAATTDPKVK